MKAYITKWALTKGIIELDDPDFYENYIVISNIEPLINPVDWFRTKQEAINSAEEIRDKKIASLRKQIAKLERMKFE